LSSVIQSSYTAYSECVSYLGVRSNYNCTLASCGAVYCNWSCLWVCNGRVDGRAVSEPYYSQHTRSVCISLSAFSFGIVADKALTTVCDVGIHQLSYEKLQQLRLEEAVRSVLILHPTHSSPVIQLCQQYGHIKNAVSFRHNLKVCRMSVCTADVVLMF